MDAGACTNSASDEGNTGLMRAAMYGHEGVVRMLLSARADSGARNHCGCTALMTLGFALKSIVRLSRPFWDEGPFGMRSPLVVVGGREESVRGPIAHLAPKSGEGGNFCGAVRYPEPVDYLKTF